MKKHHATIVLLTLFFTGLIVLWWADYAGIPTEKERRERSGMVLPELSGTPLASIRRIEIDRPKRPEKDDDEPRPRLVLERRGEGWQIVEPMSAAADPSRLETLVQNLKGLRKSPDAGTILTPKKSEFGLAPPVAVVRAFGASPKTPLAELEIGKSVRDTLYVHATGARGIEVIDARLFKNIADPPNDWRDHSVFNLPTFQVAGLTVAGPGRALNAERHEGHWTLVQPLRVPADDLKVEEVLAELTSLRVTDPKNGFVASDVRDFKPYGLDKNAATTITLVPVSGRGAPQVLLVGKPAPEHEGKLFAVRSDQDDVILVDGKVIQNLGQTPNALRSKKVASLNPALADLLRIRTLDRPFTLTRSEEGWELVHPTHGKADAGAVAKLLTKLAELQTSEFLDPTRVTSPGLATPETTTIQVWQAKPGASVPEEPVLDRKDPPSLDLKLGRHDLLKKTLFAQVAGDTTILALPDEVLALLPSNEFAFRDRNVVTMSPGQVDRLTIAHDGRTVVLAPGKDKDPNSWRLESPIAAPANDEAVTKALLVLSQLTAETLVVTLPADEKAYGLDAPTLQVAWKVGDDPKAPAKAKKPIGPDLMTLRIGARLPNKESRYASVTGSPFIFTLSDAAVLPFLEEFRNRRVLTFTLKQVERLVLKWPGRTLAYAHHATPHRSPTDWDPEPGTDASAFGLSQIQSLASDLAKLQTRKYLQYQGLIPAAAGLADPRLTIEVALGGKLGTRQLRVGNPAAPGEFYATTAPGAEGEVFLLSGSGWAELIKPPGLEDLPADVFAPPKTPS